MLMTPLSRREALLLCNGLLLALLSLPVSTGVCLGEETTRPEIKWSEAKPIIKEYVEKMSAASKAGTGVELTDDQKSQLVESIAKDMEAQHIYGFVDP
jgi:hypothetical protein